jgi:hypothetical protein
LIWRGTVLDHLWALNAPAHKKLAPLGNIVRSLFLLLGTALTAAGLDWLRRRIWGYTALLSFAPKGQSCIYECCCLKSFLTALDFISEKCEHFSLQTGEIHT